MRLPLNHGISLAWTMILASWPPLVHWVFLWGFSRIVKGWTLEHHKVLPSPLKVVDCSFFCISMNVWGKPSQGHCKHTETIWSFENSHVNLHKSSSSVPLGTGDSVLPFYLSFPIAQSALRGNEKWEYPGTLRVHSWCGTTIGLQKQIDS